MNDIYKTSKHKNILNGLNVCVIFLALKLSKNVLSTIFMLFSVIENKAVLLKFALFDRDVLLLFRK